MAEILIELHLLLLVHCHTLVVKLSHVDRVIAKGLVAWAQNACIGGSLVCVLRLTGVVHHG